MTSYDPTANAFAGPTPSAPDGAGLSVADVLENVDKLLTEYRQTGSLRAARVAAEERKRLSLKRHLLKELSKEVGFPVEVTYRRMTIQEVVATGRVTSDVREYADTLLEAMNAAALNNMNRGAITDADRAGRSQSIGAAAMTAVAAEFGGLELQARQKAVRDQTIMAAVISPMIVASDDPSEYTDPDNMLVLGDIPDNDLTDLQAAINGNEREAVERDLKSVSTESGTSEPVGGETSVSSPENGEVGIQPTVSDDGHRPSDI
jgi:hypothetical protein